MVNDLGEYPALRVEDEGFLSFLKYEVLAWVDNPFDLPGEMSFISAVEWLHKNNAGVVDKGSSLPLYIPFANDQGDIVGSRAVPVWSGVHIGFLLYPGHANDAVESFIYGNDRGAFRLGEEFMKADPAFRLALLVHYVRENVLITEIAAEAFLLDMYDQLPLVDSEYERTRIPKTELCLVNSHVGSATKRRKTAEGYSISTGMPKVDRWDVSIRGSIPKERVLREVWQEIRQRADNRHATLFFSKGERYTYPDFGASGRVRSRSGSSIVDFMIEYVDGLFAAGNFPKKGTRGDWIRVHQMFGVDNPLLADHWTPDTMRRTYSRRKNEAE